MPLSEEGPLLPPMVRRMPGRLAKERKKELVEGKIKGKTKLTKVGRISKSSLCLAEGHNKLTCPKRSKANCKLYYRVS